MSNKGQKRSSPRLLQYCEKLQSGPCKESIKFETEELEETGKEEKKKKKKKEKTDASFLNGFATASAKTGANAKVALGNWTSAPIVASAFVITGTQ